MANISYETNRMTAPKKKSFFFNNSETSEVHKNK